MADGFDIHIDGDRARQLKAAAEAAGQSPADFALDLLDAALSDDVAEDQRRLVEFRRSGEAYQLEEVLSEFEHELETRLAKPE